MFGGTTDYKTPVGIGLYYSRDWYPLSREQGRFLLRPAAQAKLISTADEAVIDYPKKKFMFVLLLDGQEVCRFLLKTIKFYMDNGLYAVSLIPKDGENEEQQFCMEQGAKRLHRMLEEIWVNPAKLITSKAVSRQNDCMDNMENVKATFAAKLEPKWIAYGSKMRSTP